MEWSITFLRTYNSLETRSPTFLSLLWWLRPMPTSDNSSCPNVLYISAHVSLLVYTFLLICSETELRVGAIRFPQYIKETFLLQHDNVHKVGTPLRRPTSLLISVSCRRPSHHNVEKTSSEILHKNSKQCQINIRMIDW